MKQITLYRNRGSIGRLDAAPCAGRLALCWAAYGYAMALFWWALPRSPLADAAVWAIALCCGLALAGTMVEV